MVNLDKLYLSYRESNNIAFAAEEAGTDRGTARAYLRREGLVSPRSGNYVSEIVRLANEGIPSSCIAGQIGKSSTLVKLVLIEKGFPTNGNGQLDDSELVSRRNVLSKYNLQLRGTDLDNHLAPESKMEENILFFSRLGSNIERTFYRQPCLLTYDLHRNLVPKLSILQNVVGFSKNFISTHPQLFAYSVKSIVDNYVYFSRLFENGAGEARDFFMKTFLILGNTLELNKKKVEYCDEVGINWKSHPQVLILGLGTEDNPGKLRVVGSLMGKK